MQKLSKWKIGTKEWNTVKRVDIFEITRDTDTFESQKLRLRKASINSVKSIESLNIQNRVK